MLLLPKHVAHQTFKRPRFCQSKATNCLAMAQSLQPSRIPCKKPSLPVPKSGTRDGLMLHKAQLQSCLDAPTIKNVGQLDVNPVHVNRVFSEGCWSKSRADSLVLPFARIPSDDLAPFAAASWVVGQVSKWLATWRMNIND